MVNQNQMIIAANTSAEKMFGYNTGELNNQHLMILIPNRFRTSHKGNFNLFIERGEATSFNIISFMPSKDQYYEISFLRTSYPTVLFYFRSI